MRPSRIAVRVLNEYRRVSPLAYLAIRHYLCASVTGRSRWTEEVAPEVLLREDEPAFWRCHQFKESDPRGRIAYRTLNFPGANCAMAEGALLLQCARDGGAFDSGPEVFSYRLAPPESAEGCFVPYFGPYTERQVAIGKACEARPDYQVVLTDIKAFYPSVRLSRAKSAWRDACGDSNLDERWRVLGERLIQQYQTVGGGLAVGPIFSHLLANLLMRDVDKELRNRFPGRYFRYVDDVALVVPEGKAEDAVEVIRAQLRKLKLKLNNKKTLCLSAAEWQRTLPRQRLNYEQVQHRDDDRWWMQCIDRLKCFIMGHPEEREALASEFDQQDIRLALPRYLAETEERGYRERFRKRLQSRAFRDVIVNLSRSDVVSQAREVGDLYFQDFEVAWQELQATQGIARKWVVSRLRSLLGRLVPLARRDQTSVLATRLAEAQEFVEYRAAFAAIAERDVSELLRFGGRICAAAGQALSTSRASVRCSPGSWNAQVIEGYMLLKLMGVNLQPDPPERITRRYGLRVLTGPLGPGDWVHVNDRFLRELASLAGQASLTEHRELLESPIDPDERWVLYADDLNGMFS